MLIPADLAILASSSSASLSGRKLGNPHSGHFLAFLPVDFCGVDIFLLAATRGLSLSTLFLEFFHLSLTFEMIYTPYNSQYTANTKDPYHY